MTDKQITTYCDEVKLTALKQFRKIQDQRKEISILHKKCMRQQADNERLKKLLEKADVNYNKCAKRFYKKAVKEFAESLCKDRVSNDPVVIAVRTELKEWLGDTELREVDKNA